VIEFLIAFVGRGSSAFLAELAVSLTPVEDVGFPTSGHTGTVRSHRTA